MWTTHIHVETQMHVNTIIWKANIHVETQIYVANADKGETKQIHVESKYTCGQDKYMSKATICMLHERRDT